MHNLESKIEAILFFKNEPVSVKEISKLTGEDVESVKVALKALQDFYKDRGIVIVMESDNVTFGTSPDLTSLLEAIQKEEFSRELGRAGLETLAIVLYKGPISRREIDYIRGVNSGFILRNLLIRGLVERTDPEEQQAADGAGSARDRSYRYKSTLKLYQHLGITKAEDLPEYDAAFKKLEEFVKSEPEENESR